MNDRIFVDTNILVYCFDDANPAKKKKAIKIMEDLWETSRGVLILQVLKEFFVTVTVKLPDKMDFRDAKGAVLDLLSWNIFNESRSSLEMTFEIIQKYHLSLWDANILSAAILSDCQKVYSEDLQHNQTIEGAQVINPFL